MYQRRELDWTVMGGLQEVKAAYVAVYQRPSYDPINLMFVLNLSFLLTWTQTHPFVPIMLCRRQQRLSSGGNQGQGNVIVTGLVTTTHSDKEDRGVINVNRTVPELPIQSSGSTVDEPADIKSNSTIPSEATP